MNIATYYAPTRISFGIGSEGLIGSELKRENAKRVLLHYGSDRLKRSGEIDKIRKLIEKEKIELFTLGGVKPNPRLSLVREGIKICKENNIDFIVAFGGGSVIDSAKAIAYGSLYDGDVWDFYSAKSTPTRALPVGCILTMAAAGSEMSPSSVITNDELDNLKRGYNNDLCRPRFAICNPEYTYTLPEYQTASGVVDILMHTIERFFIKGETFPLTDRFAIALLKETLEAGRAVMKDPHSYQARATLMWASSFSHNGFTSFNNEVRGDWAPHQMEHELSGAFDVAHGAGLSAIWSTWARYVYKENPERFASFGKLLFDIKPSGDTLKDARCAIDALEEYFKELKMPIRISELNVNLTDEDIDKLALKATYYLKRTLGSVKTLGYDEIKEIFTLAR